MSGEEGKLMRRAIGRQGPPPRLSNPLVHSQKPLASVEGLVVFAPWMTEGRINLVQTHEVKPVWGR